MNALAGAQVHIALFVLIFVFRSKESFIGLLLIVCVFLNDQDITLTYIKQNTSLHKMSRCTNYLILIVGE